jgi:conjugative relaxase-like TrwC/TraI family protein
MSDPHFHIHAFTFNATFDREEQRWKAGQFGNIKADAPFSEAAFNARLADKLMAAGYGIRRTDRSFELASVSRELIEKFSKRTREIEQFAKEHHMVLYAQARDLIAKTGLAMQRDGPPTPLPTSRTCLVVSRPTARASSSVAWRLRM